MLVSSRAERILVLSPNLLRINFRALAGVRAVTHSHLISPSFSISTIKRFAPHIIVLITLYFVTISVAERNRKWNVRPLT